MGLFSQVEDEGWRTLNRSLGQGAEFILGISSVILDELGLSEGWLTYRGPSQPCCSVLMFHIF